MRSYRTMDAGPFGGMGMTPGVKLLLIANVAVFVVQTLTRDYGGRLGPITENFGFIPSLAIRGFEVWRFITYMFLHGGITHILFNMIGLWMFGAQIESRWGRGPFLLYYLVCGLGGALTYGVFNLFGVESFVPMVGASGAIYGILLAYGMMFPESVILLAMIVPIKAKYAVILFGLIELLGTMSRSGGGVAHLAHLGGMATGFLFLRLTIPSLRAGTGLRNPWGRWSGRKRPKVVRPDAGVWTGGASRPAGEPPRGGNGAARRTDEAPAADKAEVDAVLDKISRDGLQSLTAREQEILRRAGRR
ncbi:MAG: rhomboid family intramembrane serine protease [bacterium]|nr:rhomboid family intramembrane serine protease [bacterium]